MSDIISLKMINLTPTMKCNLKCKLCGVLVPHYEYRPQMSVDEFKKTLDATFQIVDYVEKVQITGGEPLVHSKLVEMISYCFEYEERFGHLWIFTNGTIPFSESLLKVLEKYKERILVHISDYGLQKDITNNLVDRLKNMNCEYRYLKYYGTQQYYDGWVDQGDFICHNRDEETLEQIFSSCSHVCRGGSWYIRNGQMHWCGRSIRGTELEKIPLQESDYVDIFSDTIERRKEKFRQVMKKTYITACNYCNGNYGTEEIEKRYPAGEQM